MQNKYVFDTLWVEARALRKQNGRRRNVNSPNMLTDCFAKGEVDTINYSWCGLKDMLNNIAIMHIP